MSVVLSILMLAAGALLLGAYALWRKGAQRKQIVLMLVLAGIILANVAVWTIPDSDGVTPLSRVPG